MEGAEPSKRNKSNAFQTLVKRYPEERTEALEHRDFAISESRDMKMWLWLEGALGHKEIPRA